MNSIFNKQKNMPTNEQSIHELAREFQNQSGPIANEIANILFKVQTFFACTSPLFQKKRDESITDDRIIQILNDIGNALKGFYEKYRKGDQEAIGAINYCKQCIISQLDLMEKNHDKIYFYYKDHDNPLKNFMNAQPIKTARPK